MVGARSDQNLAMRILREPDFAARQRQNVIRLCEAAFAEDFGRLFTRRPGAMHLLAFQDEVLVGHACWASRRLRMEDRTDLAAAWVEAVAVDPLRQRQGIGSKLMARVAAEIRGATIGALTATDVPFYERLGWERWSGDAVEGRADEQLVPLTEPLMILRLPKSPASRPSGPVIVGVREPVVVDGGTLARSVPHLLEEPAG